MVELRYIQISDRSKDSHASCLEVIKDLMSGTSWEIARKSENSKSLFEKIRRKNI